MGRRGMVASLGLWCGVHERDREAEFECKCSLEHRIRHRTGAYHLGVEKCGYCWKLMYRGAIPKEKGAAREYLVFDSLEPNPDEPLINWRLGFPERRSHKRVSGSRGMRVHREKGNTVQCS